MRRGLIAATSLFAALALTGQARAAVTVPFHFFGGGINAWGTLTYDPSNADPISGGDAITAITGFFSDSNIGLRDVAITGLVPSTGNATPAGTSPYPEAMSYFFVTKGITPPPPNPPSSSLSYDNLYYPNGSPIVCGGYPGAGGVLDVYGLLFGLDVGSTTPGNGDVVDLFSNGFNILPAGVPIYGAVVADPTNQLDYVAAGVATPEPSTWAMLALGFAGVGCARFRKGRAARAEATA